MFQITLKYLNYFKLIYFLFKLIYFFFRQGSKNSFKTKDTSSHQQSLRHFVPI